MRAMSKGWSDRKRRKKVLFPEVALRVPRTNEARTGLYVGGAVNLSK